MPGEQTPEFNWDEINGQAVKRLRASKVKPVPPAIVRLAQKSYDGVQHPDDAPGILRHNMHREFTEDEARRAGFGTPEDMAVYVAKKLKDSGPHTQPPTSVTVVIDPDGTGNLRMIGWKAGNRRGPAAASA